MVNRTVKTPCEKDSRPRCSVTTLRRYLRLNFQQRPCALHTSKPATILGHTPPPLEANISTNRTLIGWLAQRANLLLHIKCLKQTSSWCKLRFDPNRICIPCADGSRCPSCMTGRTASDTLCKCLLVHCLHSGEGDIGHASSHVLTDGINDGLIFCE